MIRGQIAADQVTNSDPQKINNLQTLKRNLCSLVYPEIGQLKPEMCRKCIAQCGYGRRLLELMEKPENQPKKRGRKPRKEHETHEKQQQAV